MLPNTQTTLHGDKKKKLPCCNKKKKTGPWLEGTLNTEYRKEFIDKEVPVERGKAKPSELKSAGPFDGATTNKADFVAYQVNREPMCRPSNQPPENLPFNGDSTYAKEFGPKETQYQRVRPSNAYEPNPGKFYGDTTYGGDFQQKDATGATRKIVQVANMGLSKLPFEGQSVYKDNYTKQAVARRDPMAPKASNDMFPKGGFDGNTMYNSNFVPKEIAVPEQYKPADNRPMSRGGWFGGAPSTEYRGQYIDKEGPRPEAAKPHRGEGVMAKGPFDGTTTNKADFLPYAVSREKAIKPQQASDEKLPFNGESTYNNAFVGKGVPYSRVRPSNAYEPNPARFDGTTTNKTNFVPYGAMPVHRLAPNRSAFGKDGLRFEGQSTYKSNYTKMPAPRTLPFVSKGQPLQSGPFDGRTTYNGDYVEKEIPVREPDCRMCDSCEEDED